DQPYETISHEVKAFSDEVYVVDSFHNYDSMLRALGYFTFQYGKIDWIESNNEAWLQLDSRLRDDFHVTTGFDHATITDLQSKAGMKKYYKKAGIPTARYALIDTLKDALDFAKEVGYPLVMKPDHGVGASFTYQIHTESELKKIYKMTEDYQMILEEYVDGEVFTLDGIADAKGKVRFLNSLEYVGNCMDSVSYQLSIGCYTAFTISEEYKDIAQRVCNAFGLKNRFFHGEYFRLNQDKEGLGKKGDVVGLELNFRPPGGFAPDLMNYAYSIDVYDLWAEVILNQTSSYSKLKPYSAGFAGRRFSIQYQYTAEQIRDKYEEEWIDTQYLPPAFAAAMGDETIIAKFTNQKKRDAFFRDALAIQKRKRKQND
ncbi:MAG: ATP-grasp domain-containing protein, partial [Erysipelotrichaceae bacterium]|nr:ATP-grasp domain-containing protein [Erysipelotrichaceae bacterium]